jgi:hypothetical protein
MKYYKTYNFKNKRPYKVQVCDKSKTISVFKPTPDGDEDCYNITVVDDYKYEKIFIGKDLSSKEHIGNSILVLLKSCEELNNKIYTYLHIGLSIYTFETPLEIYEYHSSVGKKSKLPYAYGVTDTTYYLLSERVSIPIDDVDTDNPYIFLYANGYHYDVRYERRCKYIDNSKIPLKFIDNSFIRSVPWKYDSPLNLN